MALLTKLFISDEDPDNLNDELILQRLGLDPSKFHITERHGIYGGDGGKWSVNIDIDLGPTLGYGEEKKDDDMTGYTDMD